MANKLNIYDDSYRDRERVLQHFRVSEKRTYLDKYTGSRFEYPDPEIVRELSDTAGNYYFIVAEQVGYDTSDGLRRVLFHYVDEQGDPIIPPISRNVVSLKEVDGCPPLQAILIQKGIVEKSNDPEVDLDLARSAILRDDPPRLAYDDMREYIFSSDKKYLAIRRAQENGSSYGFDTIYLARKDNNGNIVYKKLFRGADNKYVYIHGLEVNKNIVIVNAYGSGSKNTIIYNVATDKFLHALDSSFAIQEKLISALSNKDIVTFSYEKEKAEQADVCLLYKYNELYQIILKKLKYCQLKDAGTQKSTGNDYSQERRPRKVYAIALDKNMKAIDNKEVLEEYIRSHEPVIDPLMELVAEKGEYLNTEVFEKSVALEYMTLLYKLCKKYNYKTIALMSDYPGNAISHALLHDGGVVLADDGEISYVSKANAQRGYYTGDILSLWRKMFPDIEVYAVHEKDGQIIQTSIGKLFEENNENLLISPSVLYTKYKHIDYVGGKMKANIKTLFPLEEGLDFEDMLADQMVENILQKKSFFQDYKQILVQEAQANPEVSEKKIINLQELFPPKVAKSGMCEEKIKNQKKIAGNYHGSRSPQ